MTSDISANPSTDKTLTVGKRLSREDRHAHLLGLAITAYADLGVERAGHGDVAKLANVSTATVFNYFPTRRALTDAVFERVCEVNRAIFADTSPASETTRDEIIRLAGRYNDLIQNNPDIIKVGLNWSVSFGDTVRPQYLKFQDEILSLIQSRLKGSRQGLSDARIILGAATTLSMMTLDKSSPDTLARFITRVASALDQPDR